jgi:predicted ATPase/DNA-binding SARP family transcriptional activator
MLIALLGPLEVRDSSGAPVTLAGLRLRRLLARLAVDPGRPVTAESLIDAIWDDRPPAGAASALQSLVSRLRHSLPDDAAPLESQAAGYRLAVPQDAVDIARFERLAAAGRSAAGHGDPVAASRWFAQALSLWRGAPFADLGPADFAVTAAARLTELRLRTVENRAEVILAVGQPDDVIAELAELATEYPLREQLWALHMRALCAAARPAEALACFAELRRTLGRELGTDPSPALRDLHTAILRGGAGPLAPPAWAGRPAGAEARTKGWGAARPEGRGAVAEVGGAEGEARRGNLRFALTSFVGRDDELQRVGSLLDQARLVTLVGPGGAGKTRLAVEIAARRADGIAARRAGEGTGEIAVGADDGAWVVELAALRDPAEVPATVIAALGLRGGSLPLAGSRSDPAASTTGALVEALRDRQALIVLDNCEHLVDACARVADAVLGGCRGVRILATSREPLAITGEVVCPVGPLPVPPLSAGIEQAQEFPAIRLFADRAAAACPGFTVSAENLPAVGEICRRLDGLPLAIELACARLRTLPAEEISARLGNRFRLLAAGNRTADARHRTLHAAVEWSWELFTAPERALARRLTVFADGATPEAAEAVCAGRLLPAADVLEVLGALADKSFVQLISANGAPPRYRMLETIREYAAVALEAAGEASRMRRAHAAYFLAQAETAEPALRTADQLTWLKWLTAEHDNLSTALRWAVDSADTETAIRLTAALGWFWEMRGSRDEAMAWFRAALALPGAAPPGAAPPGAAPPGAERSGQEQPGAGRKRTVPTAALATAYAFDAMNHTIDDPGRAARSSVTAQRLAAGAPTAHPVIALMGALVSGPDASVASAMAGLTELAGHQDPWVSAEAELWLAHAAEYTGDAAGSLAHFASARDRFTVLGDRWGLASAMSSLATSYGLTADHPAAIAAFGEAERLAHALGTEDDAARLRIWRALERLRAGDLAGARQDLTSAREIGHARRSADIVAFADVGLGELALRSGDLSSARTLLAGALARLDRVPSPASEVFQVPALIGLGRVAVAAHDLPEARSRLDTALRLALQVRLGPVIATVAEALAELAVARASWPEAARLLGLAAAARGAADRGSPDVDRAESAARAALAGRFDDEYAASAELSSADAVAALSGRTEQCDECEFSAPR